VSRSSLLPAADEQTAHSLQTTEKVEDITNSALVTAEREGEGQHGKARILDIALCYCIESNTNIHQLTPIQTPFCDFSHNYICSIDIPKILKPLATFYGPVDDGFDIIKTK
jgi:hypothetical protein